MTATTIYLHPDTRAPHDASLHDGNGELGPYAWVTLNREAKFCLSTRAQAAALAAACTAAGDMLPEDEGQPS